MSHFPFHISAIIEKNKILAHVDSNKRECLVRSSHKGRRRWVDIWSGGQHIDAYAHAMKADYSNVILVPFPGPSVSFSLL